jgi:hypothetical protein
MSGSTTSNTFGPGAPLQLAYARRHKHNRKNSTMVSLDRHLDLFEGLVGLNPGLDLAVVAGISPSNTNRSESAGCAPPVGGLWSVNGGSKRTMFRA